MAYKPVFHQEMAICFVLEDVQPQSAGQLSRDPPVIALYSASSRLGIRRAGELPYPGGTGRVDDVFFLDIDNDDNEEMIVIHSADPPSTWEVVDRLYDVRVFSILSSEVRENDNLSRIFGLGGDQTDSTGKIIYRFPYKNRAAIEKAANSMLGRLTLKGSIPGKMKEKAFFYRDASVLQRSNSYVVPGDSVVITDTTAGWCKATFEGKSKRTTAWLKCDSINLGK
ncbi:MAG: hypothetical protein QM599_02150 [Pseudoxanthomonas sp.]